MLDRSDSQSTRTATAVRPQRKPAESKPGPARSAPVVIVGPPGFYSEGLQRVLNLHRFRIVTQVPSLPRTKALPVGKPQLFLITDVAGAPDLPASVAQLSADNPAARFAVFVDTSDAGLVEEAMRIPAHAFLCQTIGAEALIGALDVVLGGGGVLSITFATHMTERPPPVTSRLAKAGADQRLFLSSRESDILRCLTDGISNKLIARQFDIAESTVKIHVKSILRKINVQNRTQAAIWALANCPQPEMAAAPTGPGQMTAY